MTVAAPRAVHLIQTGLPAAVGEDRPVGVTLGYAKSVADGFNGDAALVRRFYAELHPALVAWASGLFGEPTPEWVDPEFDVADEVGLWNGYAYVAFARLRPATGMVELIGIEFTLLV